MSNKDKFIMFFQKLEKANIKSTKECFKDLAKAITSDIDESLFEILKDFLILDISGLNRFEIIKLNDKQKKIIENSKLYRYEYRKYSNLRIIFLLKLDNKVILICAFNENAGKNKSKDSYKRNIERALNIIKRIKGGVDNENK